MNADSPMNPDDYQQAWRGQTAQTRVTIDGNLLLKEVQRNQHNFLATIFRRDVIEVGVGLLMLPYWFYAGITKSLPWTWWLGVPAIIWVVGFFIVDRMRHPQTPSDPGDPLLSCVKNSLSQVEHQIWLLRNVFWWYLLPFAIPVLAFFAHSALLTFVPFQNWSAFLPLAAMFGFACVFVIALYAFIYWLNQIAVSAQLEPRRQELLALLASLETETTSEAGGESPIPTREGAGRLPPSPRRVFVIACLWFVLFLSIGLGGIFLGYWLEPPFRQESPFAAVRWQESQPEVKIGEEWFTLVSIDDLPVPEILAFSRRTYGNRWRKRFEEDLVEVLTGMGHEPKDTVRLVVMPLGSQETRTLEAVPMTRENRQAIRDAARARKRSERK